MSRLTFLLAGSALALVAGPALAEAPEVREVVVTGAPYAVSLDSATTSVIVLRRDALDLAPSGGLGDALSGVAGVRSTFFGPGASRPVIRGLSGPRVLVLTNGLGQVDASALSPDHAVATDPQEAERIEVLRGPSALAYGGSAIGGVVNVIDDRIPSARAAGLSGRALAAASSVDQGRLGSGSLKAGLGDWVLTLDGVLRETRDYEVPTYPESARQLAAEGEPWPGHVDSVVENTATDLAAYGFGVSRIGERGFVGFAVRRTESLYGVPGHAHGHEDEHHDDDHDEGHDDDHGHEEEGVAIDLEQTRYDLRAEQALDLGVFDRVRLSAGYADYEHVELEGDEVGTRFLSEGWEGRLELIQPLRDGWQGAVGLQLLSRDFEAEGEEAFVPPTRTRDAGVFTLQRYDRDSWGVEGGLRIERRELESRAGSRDFTNVSASAGGFIRPAEGWFLGLSGSRTARAPEQEELFADGPHAATRAYEVGDPGLDEEVSYSLDLTAHYEGGGMELDLHLFAARYEGFIDLVPTGAEDAESELPVFRFLQTDASFHGVELEAAYALWRDGARSFTVEGTGDYVRGETDLGPPARIPPWSAAVRGVYDAGWWTGRLEVRRVGEQDRVSAFEAPTDGYTQVNASLSLRPFADDGVRIFVDARNLTDEAAREHASVLKELAPLPGRNLRLGISYRF